MDTKLNQRWNSGRSTYRPAGEVIDTRRHEVELIPPKGGDTLARAFVERHHYSESYPSARFRFALRRGPDLVGVAVFSHPCNDRVLTNVFPGRATDSVELGRFVLLDDVPGNGETWFLGRCFEILRSMDVLGVLSFSDPVERRTSRGDVVFPGHVGTIYQAHNARYLGRGSKMPLWVFKDGSTISKRAVEKIRSRDVGQRYAAELLVERGAAPLRVGEDAAAWADRWLSTLASKVRHPGCHKYAWMLDRRFRKGRGDDAKKAFYGRVYPFPKVVDSALAALETARFAA